MRIREILTGSLSRGLGVEDREWVVSVQMRLQESYGHGSNQSRQALPQCWQMPIYDTNQPVNLHNVILLMQNKHTDKDKSNVKMYKSKLLLQVEDFTGARNRQRHIFWLVFVCFFNTLLPPPPFPCLQSKTLKLHRCYFYSLTWLKVSHSEQLFKMLVLGNHF